MAENRKLKNHNIYQPFTLLFQQNEYTGLVAHEK